jgi:hypothetical protein
LPSLEALIEVVTEIVDIRADETAVEPECVRVRLECTIEQRALMDCPLGLDLNAPEPEPV